MRPVSCNRAHILRHLRRWLMLAFCLWLPAAAQAAELIMFEQANCEWCEAWREEIGPIYPKTEEGRLAPLRRVDIFAERPADLAFVRGIRFTPTFVLVEKGREIGRITGYSGEDFFWGYLEKLIARLRSARDRQVSETQ